MFLSTIDRLVSSDGGPLLIQFIFDDCVRAKKNDKRSSYISQAMSVACAVHLSAAQSRAKSQIGHVVAHGHVVSVREARARFCPWFAKICSPVAGSCLAIKTLREACAALQYYRI